MRAMHLDRGRLVAVLTVCLLAAALALPAVVLAHAELTSTSPKDGATLETSPETVSARFTEALLASKSSISVRVAGGEEVASGGVDAGDAKVLTVALPPLTAGTYQVRWTAASDDGHVERGRFEFTVAATATPEPTEAPTPTPTDEPSAAPTEAATPSSPPGPAITPAPDAGAGGSESIGQLVIIAIVGIAIGLGIGWWRSRRAA